MSSAIPTNWRGTFSNVPPLTKTLATAMTVMAALDFALRFRDLAISGHITEGTEASTYVDSEATFIPLVALVPISAPYRFWTFATASFFERSIIQYAISVAIVLGSGKYLERAWGSRELLKFLSITSIGTMLGVYFTCLFEFVIQGSDEILYDTQAYGLTGVLAGFLTAFKQLVPEHAVTLWGILSIRVKTLPILLILFMVMEGFISRSHLQLLMATFGLFIAWIYCRFFRIQDGIRGDRSESFSFASFFPEIMQPPVKVLSDACFGILAKLHICSSNGYGGSFHYDLENPQMSGMGHTFTQPGSLRAEAERRRALALKALDMRLHAAAAAANSPPFSGSARSGSASSTAPISLLSLSAGPLPTGADDDDDDEVLFKSTVIDMDESTTTSLPLSGTGHSNNVASTNEVRNEKEKA
ncbi:eukaryotic integral membrane protein-domain-containing protein [Lobosporangium transversale]|uniref:Eukaryotic integral membrane protein-domain-containing protein n=1 Tax=Lobosporangium transversale TaxID=64571 RepID=A0A1Y2GLW2_9FUNG|nr:eukaryotic integral membrane protein-domain-containing protein [Lobosporangium transversale]ORZ14902.1 eukaryotic integral membrane protein-domain-containing protein [Lobosporangium transversale]|eukprot:XP_021881034.1 eukaryotic integral membrane protein-domain-containing protein [Lobosporangium transversale]